MKLSEELKKAIIKEVSDHLEYPKDVEISDESIEITGLCVAVEEHIFIEIKEEE